MQKEYQHLTPSGKKKIIPKIKKENLLTGDGEQFSLLFDLFVVASGGAK